MSLFSKIVNSFNSLFIVQKPFLAEICVYNNSSQDSGYAKARLFIIGGNGICAPDTFNILGGNHKNVYLKLYSYSEKTKIVISLTNKCTVTKTICWEDIKKVS